MKTQSRLAQRVVFPSTRIIGPDGRFFRHGDISHVLYGLVGTDCRALFVPLEEWEHENIEALYQKIHDHFNQHSSLPGLADTLLRNAMSLYQEDPDANKLIEAVHALLSLKKRNPEVVQLINDVLQRLQYDRSGYHPEAFDQLIVMIGAKIEKRRSQFSLESFKKLHAKSKPPTASERQIESHFLEHVLEIEQTEHLSGFVDYFIADGGYLYATMFPEDLARTYKNFLSTEATSVMQKKHRDAIGSGGRHTEQVLPSGLTFPIFRLIGVTMQGRDNEDQLVEAQRIGPAILGYQPVIEHLPGDFRRTVTSAEILAEELHDYVQAVAKENAVSMPSGYKKMNAKVIAALKKNCQRLDKIADEVIAGKKTMPASWRKFPDNFKQPPQIRQLRKRFKPNEQVDLLEQMQDASQLLGDDSLTVTTIYAKGTEQHAALLVAPPIGDIHDPVVIAYMLKDCINQIQHTFDILDYAYNVPGEQYSIELAGKLFSVWQAYGSIAEKVLAPDIIEALSSINKFSQRFAEQKFPRAHVHAELSVSYSLARADLPVADVQLFEGSAQSQNATAVALQKVETALFGEWDSNIEIDATTHEPIFKLNIVDDAGQRVGYFKLYGQPVLCRSADGLSHNLIETGGVCDSWILGNISSFDEVCRVLPPSLFDQVYYAAQTPAGHGFRRGLSNVVCMAFKSRGASPFVTAAIKRFCDYFSYFTLKYNQYQTFDESFQALYQAAYDTGSYIMISEVINWTSKVLVYGAKTFEGSGYHAVGSAARQLQKLSIFALPVYQAATSDNLQEFLTDTAMGAGVQIVTEQLGKQIFNP